VTNFGGTMTEADNPEKVVDEIVDSIYE